MAAALLTSLGVPPPAAKKLARPVLRVVYGFVFFGLLAAVSVLFSLLTLLTGADELQQATEPPEPSAVATAEGEYVSPIPANVRDAYVLAAEGTIVPWTVLAAMGEVISGNGTGLSPLRHGPVALSGSSGWRAPASGEVIVVGDRSHPDSGLSPLSGRVREAGETSFSVPEDLSDLPHILQEYSPAAGSVVLLSLGESLAGVSPDEYREIVSRSAAALPANVTVLWLTADLPDWREVPVVECASTDAGSSDYPGSPGYTPPGSSPDTERSRESYYPGSPDYVPPTGPVDDGCRQTGTRLELASDLNLAAPLNAVLAEVAAQWPHVHVVDASPLVGEGMRPGPSGSYLEDSALRGQEGLAARAALIDGAISQVQGLVAEVPEGECPAVSGVAVSGGSGVFGFQEHVLEEMGFDLSGVDLENVCDSAALMVELLLESAAQYASEEGTTSTALLIEGAREARYDWESKLLLDGFWEQTISGILPFIQPEEEMCLSLLESAPTGATEDTVAGIWRCVAETYGTPQWQVRETVAGESLMALQLSPLESALRAARDAVEVSMRYSGMTPCDLFPMSDGQFEQYAAEGHTDRCDPRDEAYAAARMFHSAAASSGPAGNSWRAAQIGWEPFEGVLGAASSQDDFLANGPYRSRTYSNACLAAAREEMLRAVTPLAGSESNTVLYAVANFESLGSTVVEEELRAPLRAALEQAAGAISEGTCGGILIFPQEVYSLIRDASQQREEQLPTPEEMLDRGSPGSMATVGDYMYALGVLATALHAQPPSEPSDPPLLARLSFEPLDLLVPPAAVPPLPTGRMTSQMMVSAYSQFPGVYSDMAWQLSGQGRVPDHVPYAEDFNAVQGKADPRLLLSLARSYGPLDHEHNCDGDGPYGLFALGSKELGCGPAAAQVMHVTSRLEQLIALSGGSVQGAVYALVFGDDDLARTFYEVEGDLLEFSVRAEVPLAELGPGRNADSALAFWYESQIMFFGYSGSELSPTSSCSLAPRAYSGGFMHPIAMNVPFPVGGSAFGMRMHPVHKEMRMHEGVDWGVPSATPIYSTAPGTVSRVGYRGGYGYAVEVQHSGGISSLYAHLSSAPVSPGQQVSGGQVIGCSGNTGVSTGPHLHFEIRRAGRPENPCTFGACGR